MAEKKKTGWFQKFKKAIFGGPEEEKKVQDEKISSTSTSYDKTVEEKKEEVKEEEVQPLEIEPELEEKPSEVESKTDDEVEVKEEISEEVEIKVKEEEVSELKESVIEEIIVSEEIVEEVKSEEETKLELEVKEDVSEPKKEETKVEIPVSEIKEDVLQEKSEDIIEESVDSKIEKGIDETKELMDSSKEETKLELEVKEDVSEPKKEETKVEDSNTDKKSPKTKSKKKDKTEESEEKLENPKGSSVLDELKSQPTPISKEDNVVSKSKEESEKTLEDKPKAKSKKSKKKEELAEIKKEEAKEEEVKPLELEEKSIEVESKIAEEVKVKEEITESKNDESKDKPEAKEGKSQKKWLTKMINTLNAPIELKLDTQGDESFIGKLKGNISLGLGTPEVVRTDEDIEQWTENLREKLTLTRQSFVERLERLMHGRTKIDEDLLEEIEDILIESDVGVDMTEKIIDKIRELAKEKRFLPSEVMPSLFDYLQNQLEKKEERIIIDDSRLNIIMMVGVNGTGKTTTTGKIAAKLKISGYSVMFAAADTFRAAAIEQLEVWSQRAGVPIIKHHENADAAAVVYDAIQAAKARKSNVLLIDTAGRLHNKVNLMNELKKIKKVIDREAPDAKFESLLVLDATTGQNGLKQAMVFSEAVSLTGVALTKLDGTAKGGVIFSIKNTLNIPIKLVGVGEGLEDLRDFNPQIFIDALFSEKSENKIEESTKIKS